MGLNCPVCSYRKPDRKSLKEHICFEHLELDRYKCMLCSRTRVTKKQILEHCLAIHGQLNSPMMFNYVPEKEEKLKELMELAKSGEKQSEQRAEEERKGRQLNVVPHTLADVFNENSHIDNKGLEIKAGIFIKRPVGIGMKTAKWQTKMSYKMALKRLKMKMDAEQNEGQEQRLKRTIKMENDWTDSEADAADALLRLRFSNIHSDTSFRSHDRSRDSGIASSSSGTPFSSGYHFQRLPALLPIKRGRSKGEMLLSHTKGLKQKSKIPVGSNEKIGKKGRKAFDRYKCKKCGEVVNSNHLGHHAAYHLDNPIYSCSADDCKFTHFLRTGINLHIKQAHDGQARVEGEVTEDVKEQIKKLQMECFAGVTPQSLVLSRKRLALNLADRIRCKICDKNISNRADNLRGHCASHMLSIHQQPRFTCRLCGHSTAFYTTIRDHCITSHGNESHKEFDDAIKSWKAEHVRDVSLKCFGDENFLFGKMPQGWKPADSDVMQIVNVAVDAPDTIVKAKRKRQRKVVKEGDNVAKNQTYCNLCMKSLSARRESILQHAATHMLCLYSQPRYICRQCDYSAAHLANVRAHSVSHHKTKDRIYDDIIMTWKKDVVKDLSQKIFGDENFISRSMPQAWNKNDGNILDSGQSTSNTEMLHEGMEEVEEMEESTEKTDRDRADRDAEEEEDEMEVEKKNYESGNLTEFWNI